MMKHVRLPEIVDDDVSDLFFNTDHDNAKVMSMGRFVEWNESALRDNARMFIQSLWRLGVNVPSEGALLGDFYRRAAMNERPIVR